MRRVLYCALIILFAYVIGFCIGGAPGYFLETGNARILSLRDTFLGILNDPSCIFYNPAGLVCINKSEFSAFYASLYEGTNHGVISFGVPTNSKRLRDLAFGLGLAWLSSGRVESRDEYNRPTGRSLTDNNLAGILGFSMNVKSQKDNPLYPVIAVGVGIPFIYKSFDDISSTGYGLDLGVIWHPYPTLLLSGSLKNLVQPKLLRSGGYDVYPLKMNIGVSFLPWNWVVIAGGFKVIPLRNDFSFLVGGEVKLLFKDYYKRNQWGFVLRGSSELFNLDLSPGFGFIYGDFSIDYGFYRHDFLGVTHRMSINYRFGDNKYVEYVEKYINMEMEKAKPLIMEDINRAKRILKTADSYEHFNEELKKLLRKVTLATKEKNVPIIELIEPKRKEVITNSKDMEINLIVKDETFIKTVKIQEVEQEIPLKEKLEGFCEIRQSLKLKEGKNIVEISATDMNNNSWREKLKVTLDTVPPKIEIILPSKITTEKTPYQTDSDKVTIECTVTDNIKVKSVEIAGIKKESKDNKYSHEIFLKPGMNKIPIKALDEAGNSKELLIYVESTPKKEHKILPGLFDE